MLYLKLILFVLFIVSGYVISSKLVLKQRNYADIIMQISNMLNHFRNDIQMQNKTILEILERESAEKSQISHFCSVAAHFIKSDPEKSLEDVFEEAMGVLDLPKSIKYNVTNELKYVAVALARPLEYIINQQISSSCCRLNEMYIDVMDKYKSNNAIYKRVGILSGVALCILMI